MSKIRVPSPAMVIAVIALIAAFAGGAYAKGKLSVTSKTIKDNTIVGKDVKDNGLTGADVDESSLKLSSATLPSTVESAAVTDQGAACTLARKVPASAGITVSDPNGGTAGQCDVTFSKPISACVMQLAIVRPAVIASLNGEISGEPTTANTLRVYTFSSAGAVADRPFSVSAHC